MLSRCLKLSVLYIFTSILFSIASVISIRIIWLILSQIRQFIISLFSFFNICNGIAFNIAIYYSLPSSFFNLNLIILCIFSYNLPLVVITLSFFPIVYFHIITLQSNIFPVKNCLSLNLHFINKFCLLTTECYPYKCKFFYLFSFHFYIIFL